jgi:tetratricopeptide (TPR) repeat protein
MNRLVCILLTLALVGSLAAAKKKGFELSGKIEPPPGPAVVVLSSTTTPFRARTPADSSGEFRFKKLDPGPYKIWVFSPGAGEVEQTVAVGPSTANKGRRVEVTVPFTSPEIAGLAPHNKVSVRELAIPNQAKLDFLEARRLLAKKDAEGAIGRLQHAVEIAPRFAAAWNELGTVAYLSKRYADAEGFFRKALDNDPGSFEAIVNLGGVLLNLGRPQEALKYNTFALGERPKDALANAQMGLNYFLLGDYDSAIPLLKDAKLRDAAHFSYPQLYLADIYTRRGDTQAAIAEFEDFLLRHPDAEEVPKVKEQLARLRGK